MRRNRAMEFYRFFAAVMILCYHCYWFAFREDGTRFIGFYVFVELFFILGGFLMLASIRRGVTPEMRSDPAGTTVRYMRGRLARLYPHHLLSWLLVAVLAVLRGMWPIELLENGWPEIFLVNVFGFVRGTYVNIVCWYLSAMIFSSLIVYYLLLRDEDGFVKIVAPVLIVVCYGTMFDRKGSLANTIIFMQYSPHLGFLRALAATTVGCVAYRAYEWLRDVELPGERFWATAVEAAVLTASVCWMYRCSGRMDFLFVPLFFVFVISVFRGKSLLTRLLDNRLSGWLGRQSYAYFLNNLLVIYPYMHLFHGTNLPAMCWFCAPVCLAVSVVTGWMVKPVERLLTGGRT